MNHKQYQCYKCLYSSKKCNVITHLNRKKPCKRSIHSSYTDNEIEILNKAQFEHKSTNNYNNFNIADIINIDTQHINNITNNITINIDKIVGFNEEWVIDNLNDSEKCNLLVTNLMYTQLLKIILENELNQNVIVENEDSDKGLIFKKINNQKKYEEISMNQLINESMIKLHKQLFTIYDNLLSNNEKFNNDASFNDHIEKQKMVTDKKLNDFLNDKKIQNNVKNIVQKIFIDNKDDSIRNQKIILENKYDEENKNGY